MIPVVVIPVRCPGLRTLSLIALALTGLCLPAGLAAQDEASPVFGESIDVQVVNVEVVVLDRSGKRVTGLTAEDFELLVNREPIAIDYFSEIQAAAEPPATQVPIPADTTTTEPSKPVATTRTQPTNVLIFFDDVFAIHAKKRLVVRNLIKQLSELGPDDRVAIVSWTGRRLEICSPWTSSPEDVERVLREASKYPSRGIYYRHSPPDDLAEMMTAAASSLRLAGVPEGRRVMLLVAGGWPPSPFIFDSPLGLSSPEARPADLADAGFGAFQRLWRSRYASPVQPLIDTANSLGYTVYPVSTQGLPPSGPGVTATRASSDMGPPSEVWDGTITHLARETGGRIMWAGNRFKALGRALDDGRSYYLLGFTRHSNEVDRHRIRVRVKDGRYRLRFRRSFVDFDSRMSAHSFLEAGLLSGGVAAPSSGRLDLQIVEMKMPPRQRRHTVVEFEVAIPVGSLTFLPDAKGAEQARVELSFGVIDQRGALSDVTVIPLGLEKPPAATPENVVTYRQEITIRSRPHDLMTVLRDVATDEVFLGRAELDPPRRRQKPTAESTRPR